MTTVTTNKFGAIQGDVPILRVITRTKGGKKTDKRIVAYGEVTGHHHQIVGECEVYEVERTIKDQLFPGFEVVVADSPVTIVHNSGGEHYTVEMTPGIYFIPAPGFQQVEYDGENERRMSD